MTDYGCIKSAFMGDDPVCKIYQGDELIYQLNPPQEDYFKVVNLMPYQNNNITLKNWTGSRIRYKTNQSDWGYVDILTDSAILTIPPGGYIMIDGTESNTFKSGWSMSCNRNYKVEGDITTIYSGGTLPSNAFRAFFANDGYLKSASGLTLPATTLPEYCYRSMFQACINLTEGPRELPATSLEQHSYQNMFYGCTSLTVAPFLPAPTLVRYCYSHMFDGCTSLNTITCLATSISAQGCTGSWTNRVSSTGTFYCARGMENTWSRGADGVPTGWTITPYTE